MRARAFLIVGVTVAVAAGAATAGGVGPALPAAPEATVAIPYDFEIDVATGIPAPQVGVPSCSAPDADGMLTCTVTGEISTGWGGSEYLTGALRQPSTGRSGSLAAHCQWAGNFRATARVSSSLSVELTALSGSVKQWCNWQINVGTSLIAGSMNGGGSITLAGPSSGAYTGTLNVSVAGGTGEFAGLVGGGSFTHRQDVPLSLGGYARSLAATRSEPSRLHLSLREGKPRALVVAPGARLSKQTDSGLRVVSVPGSSCAAIATKGTRRVSLRPARDGNRDGLVVVVQRLRPKLAPGRWTIAVTCTYRVGGTAETALARVAVTVS